MNNIVGLLGFIGSGKNTAANIMIEEFGFAPLSFASTVKDVCACVFGWDRQLLEGVTPESRAWRDEVDPWWAPKLGIKDFTPRKAIQSVGTDLFRDHFNSDIWILALQRKLDLLDNKRVIITDVRFPNELEFVRGVLGGRLFEIYNDPQPQWRKTAEKASSGCERAIEEMSTRYPGVHISEWAWLYLTVDGRIHNDKMDMSRLRTNIKNVVLD